MTPAKLNASDFERLMQQLQLHEGLRLTPYRDTLGNWTFGVGYNITARGRALEKVIGRTLPPITNDWRISTDEALEILADDICRIEAAVLKSWPPAAALDPVRFRVVMDMAFNMGYRALSFKNTMAAMVRQDWVTASMNMMRSLWAKQVGDGPGKKWDRAERLARMVLTGEDYSR